MRQSSSDLRLRSYAALLKGAREAHPATEYTLRGYASRWQENVLGGIPMTEITEDFGSGAGRELDRKLCAAHSSAALVVNAFGPWRLQPESMSIAGASAFRGISFERTFSTGLQGNPPHLDLFAEGESIVAVESKCTEWMKPKLAAFSNSYDHLPISLGPSAWFNVMRELRANANQYRFVDAAQLVKHAIGLLTRFGSKDIRLVYLYWEPENGEEWAECRCHREEAVKLAGIVAGSGVRLIPMSYRELWEEWELKARPAHLPFLKMRYSRTA